MLLHVLLIPLLLGVLSPHRERLAHHAVEDVDRPLPWYAVTILVVGEVLLYLRVITELGEDVFEGQALVLGAEQIGHPLALHIYHTCNKERRARAYVSFGQR